MAVMITGEVAGQTAEGFDNMLKLLSKTLHESPGFIALGSCATDDGWRVIEIWDSKEQSDQFFAKHVAPNLTPGIRPKRKVQVLHSFMSAPGR
jgi:coenzyme F420-reducing hydrogenase gamma subunit